MKQLVLIFVTIFGIVINVSADTTAVYRCQPSKNFAGEVAAGSGQVSIIVDGSKVTFKSTAPGWPDELIELDHDVTVGLTEQYRASSKVVQIVRYAHEVIFTQVNEHFPAGNLYAKCLLVK